MFFHSWLRQHGKAFVFVFKDSLAVTNIQVAELVSLVQHYGRKRSQAEESSHHLSFNSQADYYSAIDKLVEPLTLKTFDTNVVELPDAARQEIRTHLTNLWDTYSEVLSTSVVLEVYNATACLFLPPTIEVDVERVCASAGYIFACGQLVYVRNSMTATYSELAQELRSYLLARPRGSSAIDLPTVNFNFYFKERFAAERPEAPALDGMKFWADKSALGNEGFGAIEEKLKAEFLRELAFPIADQQTEADAPGWSGSESTMWMLMDQGAGLGESSPSSESRFFIVYEQQYRNANPLDFFDENKPGWLTQTTMPHRLYRAMINVTKPWKTLDDHLSVYDPFCGTGTGAYETVGHFGMSLDFHGGDAEDLLRVAWDDNEKFYTDPTVTAEAYDSFKCLAESSQALEAVSSNLLDMIKKLTEIEALGNNVAQNAMRKSLLIELDSLEVKDRMVFWILVRVLRRLNGRAESVATPAGMKLAVKFAAELQSQTKRYQNWFAKQAPTVDARPNAVLLQGLAFSRGATYGAYELKAALNDARRNLKYGEEGRVGGEHLNERRREYDIVITDPPYGFNTVENSGELMAVYQQFLSHAISKLKNGGHLVLCLPDTSYVGKSFPFFTVPGVVVPQVLAIADKHDRVAYLEAQSLPTPRNFFAAPYYWKSAIALKRCILHFRLAKKANLEL